MNRSMRAALGLIAVVALVSIGAFLYLTRDVAAPSEAVQDGAQQLAASDGQQVVYRISQDDSQVAYHISEVLNGSDKLVIGTTSQITGDILVDFSNPAQSEVGEISINARTFATDDSRRDNSVARFILQSETDANEFITFQPTSIRGLPETVRVGSTFDIQVTGDLTIAGMTNEVSFTVSATLQSANQLVGHGETVVQRADFDLSIPNVPFVANVGDDVTLQFDFVANAVTGTTDTTT